MYTTRFTQWGPTFSKNNRPDGADRPRTRVRRLNQFLSNSHNLALQPRMSEGEAKYRDFLNSTEAYVYGLFDSFSLSADLFDIFVPVGIPDCSSDWQQIGDEFFGFTTLLEKQKSAEAQRTYNITYERLNCIVGSESDYGMITKLWPICIRLLNAAVLYKNDSILWGFLHYLRTLTQERYGQDGQTHPIPKLLNFLCQIPRDQLLNILQMGFLRTIHCLENRLGSENALVLSTWSNYMKKCGHQALPAEVLTSRYATVLQAARHSFTPTGTRTIEILHDYLYAAYYNAGDHHLTWSLAVETINLAASPGLMGDHPRWCLAVQGYALAVKLMYTLSSKMGSKDQAALELKSAISKLERGDRECRTRALMLAGVLNSDVSR